jgi:FkbM family methyltransferase
MPTWFPVARCLNAVLPYGWRLVRTQPDPPVPPPAQVDLEPFASMPARVNPEPTAPEPGHVRPLSTRFYAYLSPDVALTQLYDGHFMFVDPADEEMAPHFIANGYWEIWIDRLVRRLVCPGDRVIDVGANHGYYTLIMASLLGETGRLDSFEANPRIAHLLARSVAFHGYAPRVTVHAKAVGNVTGTAQFAALRHHSGGGHLLLDANAYPDDILKLTVPMVRLDEVIVDGPVDLIRIDAEGAEPLILEGAREILLRSPAIRVCMEWSVGMMSNRRDVGSFVTELRCFGFRFWKIEVDSSLTEVTDEELKGLGHSEIVVARDYPVR